MTRVEAISTGKLVIIDKEIDEKYWEMCKAQLFRPELIKEKAKDVRIVYTPLHGTGAMHVEKVLGDLGLNIITLSCSQAQNSDFADNWKIYVASIIYQIILKVLV